MQQFNRLILLMLTAGLSTSLGAAFGQQAAAPARPASPPAQTAANTPIYSAATVLANIGKAAGVAVVADSNVGKLRVATPTTPTTRANFTAQIAAVIKALPAGTTWKLLYLPVTAGAQNGDAVAAYSEAATRLFGAAGVSTAGTVRIQGVPLPASQAKSYVEALHLRPVYLVTNPNALAQAAAAQRSSAAAASAYNAQQSYQRAAQHAQRAMRRMTPQQRQAWQQMSPQQRAQYIQQMGGRHYR